MKKFIVLAGLFMLLASVMAAAQQGGSVSAEPMMEQKQVRATDGSGELTQERERLREHTPEEIREMVKEMQENMQGQASEMGKGMRVAYQNQNPIRGAVFALQQMRNMTGIMGIGPQVSEIARQFNNSVMATLTAEEKIQRRSAFARFFLGGDSEAAGELEQQIQQNMERIRELNQLRLNCSEDCQQLMQEQVQVMQQEQERLQLVAAKEKTSRGLFGLFRRG